MELVMQTDSMAVVHTCLPGPGLNLTFKVWDENRTFSSMSQLVNERGACTTFPCHPLLITPVMMSGNAPSGNFTIVTPTAGRSLQDLSVSEAWQQLGLQERAVFCQRVLCCCCMALDILRKAVSACHSCCC
jgi:hypothetical protein